MATIVAVHLAAALAAVGLGIGILFMRRGTPRHRWLGRVWVAAMGVTAVSSFGIRELGGGHLSWLHALAAYVLVSLVLAVLAIRRRQVSRHRRLMLGLYAGLVIAGAAAVAVPGRTLSDALAQVWHHDARQALADNDYDNRHDRASREANEKFSKTDSDRGSDTPGDKPAGAREQMRRALLVMAGGEGAR